MFNRYLFSSTTVILTVWMAVLAAADEPSCQNEGTSSDDLHPKCTCKHGFKGYNCSLRVTPCEGRPCRNGGACSENSDSTFECKCTAFFRGLLCEQRVLPCDSGPCKNGGNCTDDGLKCFKCKCLSGFKGIDCGETVQACEIKPCKNGGQCISEDNGQFTCKCLVGFAGRFCGRNATKGLYGSKILNGRNEYIVQLETWLGGVKSWRLCYRATENGWNANDFHSRCDNKQPTVTIIRTGAYMFGAYSDVAFGGGTRYKTSSKAFIFSFANKDNLPPFKSPVYRYNGNSLYTNPSYGPTFGGGHDIYIANHASTCVNSYINLGYTYQLPPGYSYSSNEARNLLSGTYKFAPSEVETFFL